MAKKNMLLPILGIAALGGVAYLYFKGQNAQAATANDQSGSVGPDPGSTRQSMASSLLDNFSTNDDNRADRQATRAANKADRQSIKARRKTTRATNKARRQSDRAKNPGFFKKLFGKKKVSGIGYASNVY